MMTSMGPSFGSNAAQSSNTGQGPDAGQTNPDGCDHFSHHTISADNTDPAVVGKRLISAAGSQRFQQQSQNERLKSTDNNEQARDRSASPNLKDVRGHMDPQMAPHFFKRMADMDGNMVPNPQINGMRPPSSHPGQNFNGQMNPQQMMAARQLQQEQHAAMQKRQQLEANEHSHQYSIPQLDREPPKNQIQDHVSSSTQQATWNAGKTSVSGLSVQQSFLGITNINSAQPRDTSEIRAHKKESDICSDATTLWPNNNGVVDMPTVTGERVKILQMEPTRGEGSSGQSTGASKGVKLSRGSESSRDILVDPKQLLLDESYLVRDLKRQIQDLQQQNKRMKSSAPGPNHATWQVLHCILNDEEYEDSDAEDAVEESVFLAEPSWEMTRHLPIPDADAYVYRQPNIAFVIYNYYTAGHRKSEARLAAHNDQPLPRTSPSRQSIRLVSTDMIAAVEEFLGLQPHFRREFANLNLRSLMKAPYLWWYRYRGSRMPDLLSATKLELFRLLTAWIDENYDDLYTRVDAQISRGMVSYVSMDFLFQPGQILVSNALDGVECHLATSWAERKTNHKTRRPLLEFGTENQRVSKEDQDSKEWSWAIKAWSYCYDGAVRKEAKTLDINLCTGTTEEEVSIKSLNVVPLRFLGEDIRIMLEKRGRVFWECLKRKLVSYRDEKSDFSQSVCFICTSCIDRSILLTKRKQASRFMVDYQTYEKLHPKARHPTYSGGRPLPPVDFGKDGPPKGPELMLLPNEVFGFELRKKKWEKLKVDDIREVSWNRRAFDHLVARKETKEILQALITSQISAEKGTDVIANKGNGLIILLHGGPGTGKTFTAESVAEMAERPLYPVTCGDIGTKPEQVEAYLESVFYLGKLWGCVVLLDEAEVFLEQRTLSDLDRNALVSVFLRALEYYEGILILTSNRVGTFDEAFKSRIQLALHYEPLQRSHRKQIWTNFFDRLGPIEEGYIDFPDIERHFGTLSEQIRNAIITARQLAQYKKEIMTFRHLRHAIEVTGEFDNYLKGIRQGFADEELARDGGIR
ncbi:unnamed protein product [Colletotrichum noveboracense]|uniref:AAA+ ATPase domain-containing protein n=1 Tax=Colletotrichum noveboracense TaxID=2664923 RepID=A0A9W4S250_9PEZI|nr:unnamed protein product [Colletotrichum noveboracense]